MITRGFGAVVLAGLLALGASSAFPRPDHVVVVVEENKSLSAIIGNAEAPYLNSLAARGAVFANFHALVHPSQPNYLALFSGSVQGVVSNAVPPPGSPYDAPNLATGLFGAGRSFAGYSEGLPYAGFTGSLDGSYRRRHNPWVNFSNVPASSNLPFSDFPSPDRFEALPTVSFVVPDLGHDMHYGSIAEGDAWLRDHLDAYVQWAATHNSLLLITWDESSEHDASNHIPTLFVGPMVKTGSYDQPVNHLHLLRTLEDLYGLPYAGDSAHVAPITDVWVESASPPPADTTDNGGKCGTLGLGAALVVVALNLRGRRPLKGSWTDRAGSSRRRSTRH